MKTLLKGFLIGLVMAFLVYLMERTTGNISWPLILSFPICWALGGYLYQKWDLGGPFRIDDD